MAVTDHKPLPEIAENLMPSGLAFSQALNLTFILNNVANNIKKRDKPHAHVQIVS